MFNIAMPVPRQASYKKPNVAVENSELIVTTTEKKRSAVIRQRQTMPAKVNRDPTPGSSGYQFGRGKAKQPTSIKDRLGVKVTLVSETATSSVSTTIRKRLGVKLTPGRYKQRARFLNYFRKSLKEKVPYYEPQIKITGKCSRVEENNGEFPMLLIKKTWTSQ